MNGYHHQYPGDDGPVRPVVPHQYLQRQQQHYPTAYSKQPPYGEQVYPVTSPRGSPRPAVPTNKHHPAPTGPQRRPSSSRYGREEGTVDDEEEDEYENPHRHRNVVPTRQPSATFKNIGIRKARKQNTATKRTDPKDADSDSEADDREPAVLQRSDRREPKTSPSGSLRSELEAMQSTLTTAITGLQVTIQGLINRVNRLESQVRNRQNDRMDDVLATLQHLKEQTRWFWAKVLPNPRKKVDVYATLPEDEENGECGQRFSIECGKWLKCCYPPRDACDDEGRMFKWLRVQSINKHTAQITDYWVTAYDVDDNVHLLGEFKFRSPEPDPEDRTRAREPQPVPLPEPDTPDKDSNETEQQKGEFPSN
jgi:hypothetical protein